MALAASRFLLRMQATDRSRLARPARLLRLSLRDARGSPSVRKPSGGPTSVNDGRSLAEAEQGMRHGVFEGMRKLSQRPGGFGVSVSQEDLAYLFHMIRSFEIRYALRLVRRHKGFALAVLVSTGLGVGATASIFSLIDAFLLRPLPVPATNRVVRLTAVTQSNPVGLLFTLALSTVIGDLLNGVNPRDPTVYVIGTAVLLSVTIFATYLPARRASHVDPQAALRAE